MATKMSFAKMFSLILLICGLSVVESQRVPVEPTVLTPPYFNLAYNRRIEASSTCGIGNVGQERYCKLTGADPTIGENDVGEVIQGQACDVCLSPELAEQLGRQDPAQAEYYRKRVHTVDNAVDGSERWWQSPPLSRGLQYDEVNITVDLGQIFHVAYVFIRMANSPRPGVWALDRSTDFGRTWRTWMYFADSTNECYQFFGRDFSTSIERDDSVICSTEFSNIVPLENGEMAVSLVNRRPSARNFSYSPDLQEWTKATNVRLRLIQTQTLFGQLMAVRVDQDPTVTRRYFYSIKDISIGGRCVCNGHADVCNQYGRNDDPINSPKLVCDCQHNTCGDQCQTCCPGYVQKLWRPATPYSSNECEPCQCYGHTNECIYDPEVARQRLSVDIHGQYAGGGVCQNCRDNTEGINCERCVSGFYHPDGIPLDSRDACQPCNCDLVFSTGECDASGRCLCRPQYSGTNCDRCAYGYMNWPECEPCECNLNGTLGNICEARGGQCPCKPEFDGQFCDRCAWGYWGYPNCQRCSCSGIGVLDGSCDQRTGQCVCKNNYAGINCERCTPGYYNFPACNLCGCDPDHTTAEICDDRTGQCVCRDNYSGARCDSCELGYYRYPTCIECGCQQPGSVSEACDYSTGQCRCQANFAGQFCDNCAAGYYNYPECRACDCDTYGSYGKSCNQQTGQCDCKQTFMGQTCSQCRPNYYNYPNCEECNCNPEGAEPVPGYPLGGCGSVNAGVLCECKDHVMGRICDTCMRGYWNLDRNNPDGCTDCGCHRPGTTGGQNLCDTNNGQCVCKTFTAERRCEQCADGTYNLQEYNHFGCEDCACDVGGAVDHNCNKDTGQCNCRPRIDGDKCDQPIPTHYFPTLYQHQYELEDGRTIRGGPVRYGYDASIFPGYSWRGYAVLSRIQDEVLFDIDIDRPTLFRIVYHFVNRNQPTVTGQVTITADSPGIEPQASTVYFQSTNGDAAFATASTPVYLTTGRWTVSLKSPKTLFLDYMVLIPREYYEASILQQPIYRVCKLPDDGQLCQHYVYVDVVSHPTAKGSEGQVRRGNSQDPTQLYPDSNICNALGVSDMAYLDSQQTDLNLSLLVGTSGRYYLVLLYYSAVDMRTQTLDMASSGSRGDRGHLHLASCPYSSLCRQVVVDGNGDAMQFDIGSGYTSVTLSGQMDVDVAVESVVAIPASEWDLEVIQPRLKCIRRNGQCQQSNFQAPTGTAVAQVEEGPNQVHVADEIPPNIIDTTVKLIKLNGQLPQVSVKASVDRPGSYAVVVHYFQPYDIGFDVHVEVLAGLTSASGSFRANYCPSVSGCRATISFDEDSLDGEVLDLRDLNFVLTFNNSAARPLWLDYVMVVPARQLTPQVLHVRPEDKSEEFIRQCAQDNFYIDPQRTSQFCRDGVFSLAADYNNGAISCDCDTEGATSFTCDQFGGQCRCKPNVIGRACTRCRTGFYRFPDCLPCNCPSGLCDDRTGQCMCPPRVTGALCDTCEPLTFGFDPLIGCEMCDCDPEGVRRRNLECNTNDGQCDCRAETMGRRCDQCRNGYYRFPTCLQCNCETAGTLERVCDPTTAQCLCKENVEGDQCQQCVSGTFYLEDRNPKGCSSCFCFGFSNQCMQSGLRWTEVSEMEGWGISNVIRPDPMSRRGRVDMTISPDMVDDANQPHYWILPAAYLNNKVASYGGQLSYTLLFEGRGAGPSSPDVRIEGGGLTLVHYLPQEPNEGRETRVEVDLLEIGFEHEDSGSLATREQMMTVLLNIQAMQIRASYADASSRVSIEDVTMQFASEGGRGQLAPNVEQCLCPRGYSGTSCERCADGYYRLPGGGQYMGQCVPCQCHGRSDRCDPDTGMCTNCRDDFEGPQCLTCRRGHYFDERDDMCRMCSCPMAIASNNFASSCEVDSFGSVIQCLCEDGYEGYDCRSCSPGWWGNPEEVGNRCQPCDCSGNIDPRDPLSCDRSTGACLRCINNAAGDRCDRCREWYYGDAIDLKDCQQCDCNRIGAESCDHRNGVCHCKPHVVGPTCDRCERGTYGFELGNGCQQCDCAAAVYSDQCDETSGQCQCKPGVTGRRCDQCQRGYYGYTAAGCRACDCTSEGAVTCDPVSGRCQCLPGVTGPKCDQCLPRWVLIPDQGCEECDNCIHTLLDDVDEMMDAVRDMNDQLGDVSVGQDAIRRLNQINQTVVRLRPQVDDLDNVPTDPAMLQPLKDDLQEVIDLSKDVRDKGHRLAREADVVQTDARDVREDTEQLTDIVRMAVDEANDAVLYANDVLTDILNNIANANVEQLLQQAEAILVDIKNRNFNQYDNRARDELRDAEDLLRRVRLIHNQAMEQVNRTTALTEQATTLRDQLMDLMNSSRHTIDNSQAALDMNEITDRTIDEIKFAAEDAAQKERDARELLEQARRLLGDAEAAYAGVEREATQLDYAKQRLADFVANLTAENNDLRPLVERAMEHALGLKQQADNLDTAFADARHSAEGAINASNAYKNIVKAIDEAYNASLAAKEAGEEALDMSFGLAERAREARALSVTRDEDASDTKAYITDELRPRLDTAEAAALAVQELNDDTRAELQRLNAGLDMLPAGGYQEEAQQALDKAMDAQMRAERARDKIRNITQGDLERARELAELIEETNMGVMQAQQQVEDVQNLIPDITGLLTSLEVQRDSIKTLSDRVALDLSQLREKISISRGEANQIKVGVAFQQDTALQVRNPKNMVDAGGYTRLSFYVNTQADSGFLAYVGSDANQPASIDWMALEIIDGKVVFKYDLGDGLTWLENPRVINDNQWHEIIAERVGKAATLTIRTDNESNEVVNKTSDYNKSVFDIDPDTVKFYIGGVPDSAGLQGRLASTHLEGCMEEVMFDGTPVGLWNFVYGENNYLGCIRRSELTTETPKEYRFSGDGYVVLDKLRWRPSDVTQVTFSFRTYAEDGLMFLVGEEDNFGDYFAVEMRGGKVVFQYDLGSGPSLLETTEALNDGMWHTVTAHRAGKSGIIKIDKITVDQGSSRGTQKALDVGSNLYVGGYVSEHRFPGVTNTRFEGCIKDLKLGSDVRELSNNLVSLNVVPGCIDTARVVSFSQDIANSYIAMDPVSIDNNFLMTMKVRSTESDGLIFYATDDSQRQVNAFSVVMKDGNIGLIATPEDGQPTSLETNRKYNDGNWHYVTVAKSGREISIYVDDSEMMTTRYEGRRRISTTTALFFGGVRPGFDPVLQNTLGVSNSFYGCIGDVAINNRFLNFALSAPTDRAGVALSVCPVSLVPPTMGPYPTAPPIIIFTVEPGTGGQCALTQRPDISFGDPVDTGTRFLASADSRWEFEAMPATFLQNSDFTLEFKTTTPDGVLFYASDETDFITLYMQDGQLHYSFNCGSGKAELETQLPYNNDEWHKVKFSRLARQGSLEVDDLEKVYGESFGSSSSLNVKSPFYVGGIDPAVDTGDNLPAGLSTFNGCIRNPQLNEQGFGEPNSEFNTQPCTGLVEQGTFFRDGAGYISLIQNFEVPLDIEIALDIRPRTNSGVLVSVYNPDNEEFLVIQLKDGDVIFNVNNGEGNPELVTTHKALTSHSICDGGWHTIIAGKYKNVVRMTVDGYSTDAAIGVPGVSQTETNNPLYIGGVPSRHKGIKTHEDYVGCIRNLQIERKSYNLASGTATDGVIPNQCPTN